METSPDLRTLAEMMVYVELKPSLAMRQPWLWPSSRVTGVGNQSVVSGQTRCRLLRPGPKIPCQGGDLHDVRGLGAEDCETRVPFVPFGEGDGAVSNGGEGGRGTRRYGHK